MTEPTRPDDAAKTGPPKQPRQLKQPNQPTQPKQPRERVLVCPVCLKAMRTEREEGVTIDHCPEHGIWLDAGELEEIVRRIKSRARRRRKREVKRARDSGKRTGAMFGWWSLLFD